MGYSTHHVKFKIQLDSPSREIVFRSATIMLTSKGEAEIIGIDELEAQIGDGLELRES